MDDLYGEVIYGTRGGPFLPNEAMVSTQKGNNIYIHSLKNPEDEITLKMPKGYKVKKSHFMNESDELNSQKHFKNPVVIKDGVCQVPQVTGMSTDLIISHLRLLEISFGNYSKMMIFTYEH